MKKAYQKLLENKQLIVDPAQCPAIEALVVLSEQLCARQNSLSKFKNGISGIYFHGRVGRGKTMLMDLFYQHLPLEKKKRIHFHHFMESVHQQLAELTGKSEPLCIIAKQWSSSLDILCFDEFFVNDIGDAMLLSGLFSELFSQGLTLVATSNCTPEQLYGNGLQRERFLPTIDLINKHCQVISIDGDVDHRRNNSESKDSYDNYYLLAEDGNEKLIQRYKSMTDDDLFIAGELEVNHRNISYLYKNEINKTFTDETSHLTYSGKSKEIILFDFFALCSGPRSQRDYMVIAKEFDVVFITNVPKFSGTVVPAVFSGVEDGYQRSGVLMGDLQQLDDEARRFIALVDEFYDQNISLIISAEVDIFELYQGQQLAFEFERCQSRLVEMQRTKSSC